MYVQNHIIHIFAFVSQNMFSFLKFILETIHPFPIENFKMLTFSFCIIPANK